jgi:hypothetical protein
MRITGITTWGHEWAHYIPKDINVEDCSTDTGKIGIQAVQEILAAVYEVLPRNCGASANALLKESQRLG